VNARVTRATSQRVLLQLRHDPRTIGLLLVVPCALLALLAWIISDADFDKYGPMLLGIFPLMVMFLVTSVATLRERTSGTLERLLTLPMGKLDFLLGYALAFGLVAVVQAVLASALSFGLLGLDVNGPVWCVVLVSVLVALLGTSLGLAVSALARTEFQAVQFLPVFLLPQLLLCGILGPRDELPTVLRWVSDVLPLTYAVDAMLQLSRYPDPTAQMWRDVAVVIGFTVGLLVVGAATLRRRTP
jgi:ABC-2 type transport system permease protein